MENILCGLDELKANGMSLSIHNLIQILQKIDSSNTLKAIEVYMMMI